MPPPREDLGKDKLVFGGSVNGRFSVKKAYSSIMNRDSNLGNEDKEFWQKIWKEGDVQPRVRLHVRKLLNDALPLGKIINHRIGKGGSECASCGVDGEDVHHLLFSCPFARACCLAGPLALRSGSLPNLKDAISTLHDSLAPEQWSDFMNTTWALWRCRNDKAYSGNEPTLQKFNR